MLGPLGGGPGAETAFERGRIVRFHRPIIIRAIAVDQPHAADREPLLIKPTEHPDEAIGVPAMDDEPATVGASVEADVREIDQAKIPERHRTARMPGASD